MYNISKMLFYSPFYFAKLLYFYAQKHKTGCVKVLKYVSFYNFDTKTQSLTYKMTHSLFFYLAL